MNVWGLVQSKRLTTPVIVCSFDMSNAANEWCADSSTLPIANPPTTTDPITKSRNRRMFIFTLLLDVDAGLAVLIHGVAVVLFADVLGDRPRAMPSKRPRRRVRRRERFGIGDRRLDGHRVGIGEREALDDLHLVAVRRVRRDFGLRREPDRLGDER